MFNKIKQFVYILSLLVFVACSDDATTDITMGDKTPIELSVGGMDDGATTRAVITDGTGKTLVAMSEGTGIRISMMSEYNTTFTGESWAFQGLQATKYCTTLGTAEAPSDNKAPINFGSNIRYWDDAHARSSMLSLWGLAVPGKATSEWTWKATSDGTEVVDHMPWGTTTTPTQIYWAVSDNQNGESMAKEDLCFSNNLANHTSPDNRLKFNATTRKFDTGNMIFYHALTQFTIKIKCGDGFVGNGSDFQFTNLPPIATATNSFALNGFYGKGVFDVKDGEFRTSEGSTISSIYLQSTTPQKKDKGDYYVLRAYVLPGTDLRSTSVADAFSFTIDHNNYKISMQDLYDAISDHNSGSLNTVLGEGRKLLAGMNYEFTFTVDKTKISGMTAQIQEWGEVKADNITPSNARINLKLEERGTEVTSGVDFYRALDLGNTAITDTYVGYNWITGYLTDGKATASYSGSQWTISNWYWPNNTAFYHFRAVGDGSSTSPVPPTPQTDATYGDYFALTAGESYWDYTWGAPFLDDQDNEVAGSFKWTYSRQHGFDGSGSPHQIYHGIGPTNSVIKILMFHMMSDVTIKIKTTTGKDKVTLDDGTNKTTAVLKNLHTSGKVLMGNGLVQTTGSAVDVTVNLEGSSVLSWNNYGAIPQDLSNVVLEITTPDKNLYKVVMKDVISTSYTNSNIQNPYSAGKINYWYPGFKYEYTFTLSKKKIENITATILDWETVTAGDDNVQIQ